MTRHRGPKEERESVIRTDQDLDPAPYLRILREIDSQMGKRGSIELQLDVNERGDVLVFLSGLREINILVNALTNVLFVSISHLVCIVIRTLGNSPSS